MPGQPRPEDLARFREGLLRASRGPRPFRQGRFERLLRAAIRAGCRVLGWRVEVRGLEHLPASPGRPRAAGCVVAGVPHRAWVEPFLLVLAWPPDAARLVWVGDGRTMTSAWWRRALFARLGMIPIASGAGGPQAYAEVAVEALAAGATLAIAPESGPPSPPDRTRPIARGFAYLALRSGAPIVPVVFGGTHRILRDVTFTIDVLAPIDPGPPMDDPFTPVGRTRAVALVEAYEAVVDDILPARAALADARRPRHERWRWLGSLLG